MTEAAKHHGARTLKDVVGNRPLPIQRRGRDLVVLAVTSAAVASACTFWLVDGRCAELSAELGELKQLVMAREAEQPRSRDEGRMQAALERRLRQLEAMVEPSSAPVAPGQPALATADAPPTNSAGREEVSAAARSRFYESLEARVAEAPAAGNAPHQRELTSALVRLLPDLSVDGVTCSESTCRIAFSRMTDEALRKLGEAVGSEEELSHGYSVKRDATQPDKGVLYVGREGHGFGAEES